MDLEEAKKIFNKLYEKVDGRSLSLKGREDKDLKSKSFVYGEVVPDSFYQLLADVSPQPGQVFYDLGSGTGKAVFLAHLLYDFSHCKGIELVEPLYEASHQVSKMYESEIRPTILDKVDDRKVTLIQGNFLEQDISDADVIFMNSTCFQDDLMEALEVKLECVHANAHIISLSKPLRSPSFHQYKHKMYDFSWGQATAFYHRKRLWKVYG